MGGAVLINSSTGKPEWVDSAHVKDAVERGSHYSKSGRVNVKSTHTGGAYNTTVAGSQNVGIETESVGTEIKKDYDTAENAKYDNLTDKFITATEGFASSITFGLADPLMDDYSTRKRAEVNSGWRTFGEVTGIVAPALLSGGVTAEVQAGVQAAKGGSLLTKALKEAIRHTPAGLGMRASSAIGRKAGTKLLEGSIRQKVVAAAAESAVEGAMWNTGQQLSEAIIEDKEFSAEALLGAIAEGGVIGGGIGGAFAGAGAAIKAYKGRKGKNVHALFDLDSDVSVAFRSKMAGSADEAIRFGSGEDLLDEAGNIVQKGDGGFERRIQDIQAIALREGKDGVHNQKLIEIIGTPAQKGKGGAIGQYEKAKDGYRKILGLKPGHSAKDAEAALYRLMRQGGKNDIIEFAKRLDGLHSATAHVDELLRVEGKLDDSFLKPTNEVGGYIDDGGEAYGKYRNRNNTQMGSTPFDEANFPDKQAWPMGPATPGTQVGYADVGRKPAGPKERGVKTSAYSEADHAAAVKARQEANFGKPQEGKIRFGDFPEDAAPGHAEARAMELPLSKEAEIDLLDSLDNVGPEIRAEIENVASEIASKRATLGFDNGAAGRLEKGKTLRDYEAAINAVAGKTSPDLSAKINAAAKKDSDKISAAVKKDNEKLAKELQKQLEKAAKRAAKEAEVLEKAGRNTQRGGDAAINAVLDGGKQTKVGNAKGSFPDPVSAPQAGPYRGGMQRPEGTLPPQDLYGMGAPLPFVAEWSNQAAGLSNDIVSQAQKRAANYSGSFNPRKYTDDIKDLADSMKDEYGNKFKAMDGLYVADALGMDVNKIPVLGPVADSFLKLWVFYRMGGMIGNSKIVQKNGKSRLAKEMLSHAIAAKAGNLGYQKAGVAGGAAAYQAGKFGVNAAIEGIGNIGAHTSKMGDRIRGAVDKVMNPTVKRTIKKATPALVFTLSNAAYSEPLDSDPKDDYGRIAAQLERSAHDQGSLQNYLNAKYEDARILDAGLADELVKRTMAQMQYLEKKLPKPPITWPAGMPWKPPASEMIRFKQTAAILAYPDLIMEKFEAGTLQQADLEDAAQLWPSIHNKLVEAVMDRVQDFEKLSGPHKRVISMITGQTMSASADPWLISYTQESFKKAKNEEESHNATIAGANSVKAGTATPGQQYGLGPQR